MAMPLTVRRFSVDEYHRMAEAGILHEDDRVELLDGQIVPMTPIGPDHSSSVTRLTALFAPLAATGRSTLSVQNPVILGEYQEPQPDVALLRYRADGYRIRHPGPGDILLIVEVGDSTVDRDRAGKMPLYAWASVPEAWLVNLPGDGIEVHRDPRGGHYADVRTAQRGEAITPLAFPDLTLRVDDILS